MSTLSYKTNLQFGHLTVQSPGGGGLNTAFAAGSRLVLSLFGGDTISVFMCINSNGANPPNVES
jgi:hypothetical protein